MPARIQEAAEFLAAAVGERPAVGMITGTGLGSLSERILVECRIPYEEIPNFPRSTVKGHKGTLVMGTMAGIPIVAMEGRFHLYEGYSPVEVTFPVRVMARLGVRILCISSAVGGLNPLFEPGDLMMVTDHINLTGTTPLTGPNMDELGPRFPDMSAVYDPRLRALAREAALESGVGLREGVYVGLVGPSLETPAETRFLRMAGGDAVGMSTVPEAIAAVHGGLRILAIVVVTNVNLPDCMKETSLEQVIATAQRSSGTLCGLWERILARLPEIASGDTHAA